MQYLTIFNGQINDFIIRNLIMAGIINKVFTISEFDCASI